MQRRRIFGIGILILVAVAAAPLFLPVFAQTTIDPYANWVMANQVTVTVHQTASRISWQILQARTDTPFTLTVTITRSSSLDYNAIIKLTITTNRPHQNNGGIYFFEIYSSGFTQGLNRYSPRYFDASGKATLTINQNLADGKYIFMAGIPKTI